MPITSTRNPVVRYVRSLERPAVRRRERVFVVEGVRLVAEAIETGQKAQLVLYAPQLLERTAAGSALATRIEGWSKQAYEVDGRVLAGAAQTEHPAGILAVVDEPDAGSEGVLAAGRFGVVLDGVSDPGNAGTILRTAAAFGADWVAAPGGSVDLFSAKVVRGGMGAHFRLPLRQGLGWDELVRELGEAALVATDAADGTPLQDFEWPERTALIIGSEARGLSDRAGRLVRNRVRIPLRPGVESLNAAVAAGIVLYAALGDVPAD